ncbi:MAG: hypothetical protein CSA50_04735 [Gammaproteobacteria bacterium]|nr:MAG: hypothetical protein CSA50_04735 [Gammaproteobacteria bacterium]
MFNPISLKLTASPRICLLSVAIPVTIVVAIAHLDLPGWGSVTATLLAVTVAVDLIIKQGLLMHPDSVQQITASNHCLHYWTKSGTKHKARLGSATIIHPTLSVLNLKAETSPLPLYLLLTRDNCRLDDFRRLRVAIKLKDIT